MRGWPGTTQLVEESVHLFGGKHRRNAFGQFRRGNEARRIFFQTAFPDTVFEERAEGGEFAGDGTFFEALVVEIGDEFADHGMGDLRESGRQGARWREKGKKLAQILAIVRNGVRRRISYCVKIFQVLVDSLLHSVVSLGDGQLTL